MNASPFSDSFRALARIMRTLAQQAMEHEDHGTFDDRVKIASLALRMQTLADTVELQLPVEAPCAAGTAESPESAPVAIVAQHSSLTMPAAAYTVERHGNGWAIYQGRDGMHHGWNLGHLTECDEALTEKIELGLNLLRARERQETIVGYVPVKALETVLDSLGALTNRSELTRLMSEEEASELFRQLDQAKRAN